MSDFDLGTKFGTIEAQLAAGNKRFESMSADIRAMDTKLDTLELTIERMESKMWKAVAFAAMAAAAGGAGFSKLLGVLF